MGTTPYGTPIRVVDLGVTHLPKDVFESYLQEISPRYTAETYSLLTHNCNNFSNEVAQFLVGVTIPEYILNLPNEVMSSPMGALMCKLFSTLHLFILKYMFLIGLLCDVLELNALHHKFEGLDLVIEFECEIYTT